MREEMGNAAVTLSQLRTAVAPDTNPEHCRQQRYEVAEWLADRAEYLRDQGMTYQPFEAVAGKLLDGTLSCSCVLCRGYGGRR